MPVESIENVLHHGWPEIEAEVTDCRYVPGNNGGARGGCPRLPCYAIGFTYKVEGMTYEGVTQSSVEARRHDKFPLRYKPGHPDENNSLASECDRPWFNDYMFLVGALVAGAMLYAFAQRHLFHR